MWIARRIASYNTIAEPVPAGAQWAGQIKGESAPGARILDVGKPYESELGKLAEVYEWTMALDVRPVVDIVASLAPQSLLAVGSGGSLTAATAACYFHERYAQKLARAITPLDAVSLPALEDVGVLITSGAGRNPDVLGCFDRMARKEPQELAVICAAEGTPLAGSAAAYWYTHAYEFSPPSGKDGFVATNTLISTVILLARAYQHLYSDADPLPTKFAELGVGWWGDDSSTTALESAACSVAEFDSLLVLYGPTGFAAAVDFESKCSETGLANVQLADYRNFAHGRHHGLDRRSSTTAVVAIITKDDRELATKTLAMLPKTIVTATIEIHSGGGRGLIAALVAVIMWVGFRGRSRNIDPGRPTVAPFGRKLYHLSSFGRFGHTESSGSELAIERKANTSIERLKAAGSMQRWAAAVNEAVDLYARAKFHAAVFDYDGTLCHPRRRYRGIHHDMAAALVCVLRDGLVVGIATGRGKSVRADLIAQIPLEYWERIWIGYYNGGQIATLADDTVPDKTVPMPSELERLASRVETDDRLSELMEIDRSSSQVTVFPKAFREEDVWQALQELCRESSNAVVRSTHSFDVLAPGVSKLNVVRKLTDVLDLGESAAILRIGDLGRWPGNDHELLADTYGVSVDQVSLHPSQCWNFAPAGHRGTQATLDYLAALKKDGSGFAFDLQALGIEALK